MKKKWFDNVSLAIGAIVMIACIILFIWVAFRIPVILMVSILFICIIVWVSANTNLLNLKVTQKASLHLYSFLICSAAIFFMMISDGRAKTSLCKQFIRGKEKSAMVEFENDNGDVIEELRYYYVADTKIGEANMVLIDLFLATLGIGSLLFIYHHTSRFNFKHKLND